MLAAIRPDSWNIALLVHVLGAMILIGGLVTAFSAQVLGWRPRSPSGAVAFARVSFWSLLAAAIPGWILMRIGAEWIWTKEGWDDVSEEPDWLGIGWITADLGGLLILISVILAGLGLRGLRRGGGGASVLARIATLLTAIALVAYLVTVWAMSGKPG
jgi:hypothetical protein